ncbi:hypothetical protein CCACVL1_11294 [Corchorus capsularis]|uniref:HMA domain-containing protein n=1 Tax=Corchorus capsularis TaxID=210143 RepID=A0A1R3IM63_COCAP|nr:hypothetical protein CCACVL1_11294 [Corchorus capsularis]
MFSLSSSSETYLTCGIKVDPKSTDWCVSITKILKKLKGARYTIDAEQGMALVSGRANYKKFLKKLKKSKSDVAWVNTGRMNSYGGGSHGGYYGSDPYQHQYAQWPVGYHYSTHYSYAPYAQNPPHFNPYSYWSTHYY